MSDVIVVYSHPDYGSGAVPFPPIGTVGTAISDIDEYGVLDVLFDGFPRPVNLPDTSWVTHKSMIVFIDKPVIEEKRELVCLT